jgi:hypothetical protein
MSHHDDRPHILAASGLTSIEAEFDLGEATDATQIAIDHMQEAAEYDD